MGSIDQTDLPASRQAAAPSNLMINSKSEVGPAHLQSSKKNAILNAERRSHNTAAAITDDGVAAVKEGVSRDRTGTTYDIGKHYNESSSKERMLNSDSGLRQNVTS